MFRIREIALVLAWGLLLWIKVSAKELEYSTFAVGEDIPVARHQTTPMRSIAVSDSGLVFLADNDKLWVIKPQGEEKALPLYWALDVPSAIQAEVLLVVENDLLIFGASRSRNVAAVWRLPMSQVMEEQAGKEINPTEELSLCEVEPARASVFVGVCRSEQKIWLVNARDQQVLVLNEKTLQEERRFPVENPSGIAIAKDRVWIVENKKVSAYTKQGRRIVDGIIDEVEAKGLATDAAGRLVVCDQDADQRLQLFNVINDPVDVRTLGELFGIYGDPSPGRVGPMRFAQPSQAVLSGSGGLVVLHEPPSAGWVVRGFAPERDKLLWELSSCSPGPAVDLAADGEGWALITPMAKFQLLPTKSSPTSGSMVAHTLNPFRYPDDIRRHLPQSLTSVRALAIGGASYMACGGENSSPMGIFRFVKNSHIAVPCGLISAGFIKSSEGWSPPEQPGDGPWMWIDKNADGMMTADEYVTFAIPEGRMIRGFAMGEKGEVIVDFDGISSTVIPLTSQSSASVLFYDPHELHSINKAVHDRNTAVSGGISVHKKSDLAVIEIKTASGAEEKILGELPLKGLSHGDSGVCVRQLKNGSYLIAVPSLGPTYMMVFRNPSD